MKVIIQGNVIDVPNSGASPNWSSGILKFITAVTNALATLTGTYDVSPRTLDISNTPNTVATDVPSLAFPTSQVRGSYIRYTVYRTTTSVTKAETGNLTLVYNDGNSVSQKWELSRDCVGDSQLSFSVLDTGQVQFTLTALAGTNHVGQLNYTAQAIQQSY